MPEIINTPTEYVELLSCQDGVSIEVLNNEVQIEVQVIATGPQGPPGSGVAMEAITNEELEEMLQ